MLGTLQVCSHLIIFIEGVAVEILLVKTVLLDSFSFPDIIVALI